MQKEVNTIEEATAFVNPLVAENKWAISVMQKPGGSFVINWFEHKKYTTIDGKEFLDEIWTTKEGELKFIQDLEPEHARNILRMIIRNERQMKEVLKQSILQLEEELSDEDEEEVLFPNWPQEEPKTIH